MIIYKGVHRMGTSLFTLSSIIFIGTILTNFKKIISKVKLFFHNGRKKLKLTFKIIRRISLHYFFSPFS